MTRNFVAGAFTSPDVDHTPLVDPCTGAKYDRLPLSREREVDAAVSAAEDAFETWRVTRPIERQGALSAIADRLVARAADFRKIDVLQTGNTAVGDEVELIADQLRFFGGMARSLEGRSAGEYTEGHTSYIRREPIGVCVGIAPWNFPLLMAVLRAVPAIATGNTTVLKPAPTTPGSALLLAEISDGILPPGVFNVVCGDDETGRLLVDHLVPSVVTLTGSINTGIEVATLAARSLKQVHLELGGKTPVVVTDHADLDAAVEGICIGAFTNAGQDCTATSRVIVHTDVHDELVERLERAIGAIRPGVPDEKGATYGPLNNEAQVRRLSELMGSLPEHTDIRLGGRPAERDGFFFEPTLVVGVRNEDAISRMEVFGPVVTVQRSSSLDEAIHDANDVPHGLAASVWTEDHREAMRLSNEIDAGCEWVNTSMQFPSEMPHGGFKHSGYGKDLSVYGVDVYTRIKHVMHSL